MTSQAGYRGLKEVVGLCTVSARDDPSEHFLYGYVADLYKRICDSEDGEFFFVEYSTAFLSVITALLDSIGCSDEYEKLRVFQTLALTTENHFKKD